MLSGTNSYHNRSAKLKKISDLYKHLRAFSFFLLNFVHQFAFKLLEHVPWNARSKYMPNPMTSKIPGLHDRLPHDLSVISDFFPSMTAESLDKFHIMSQLYPEWNEKINVISRKDIDNLIVNHILHSLAIAKFIRFSPGSTVIDLGTGGGFPGIPLAALFPDVHFHLVDRIRKKLSVAADVAQKCGLKNVSIQHGDIGECKVKADFVVSRAVMPQPDLVKLVGKNISKIQNNALPNGIIALKGGNLDAEIKPLASRTEIVDIADYFPLPFFETKKIVYTSKYGEENS